MSETRDLMITRHLPVKLTDGRRLALGCELAEQRHDERKHTEYLENIKKSIQAKVKECQHRQNIAAEALHQGFEMAEVACRQVIDYEKNLISVVRDDTGELVDKPRVMTPDEVKHFKRTTTVKV